MTLWQTLGFFALCLLSSAAWLTDGLLRSPVTPTAGAGFRLLLVGAAGALAIWRAGGYRLPAGCALVGVASLGLIGIPFLLLAAAEGKIASTSGVLVFAGMPILLTVVGAASSSDSGLRLLPYGLLGVAGLLTLLPFEVPRGEAGVLGAGLLILAMISVASSLIWLHGLLDGFPILVAVSLAGFANGILLMLAAGVSRMPHWGWQGIGVESLRCLLFDLPETILLLWLTRTMTPEYLAVRYVVAPLLTVVGGILLLRPRFEVRTLIGLLLVGFGAYGMLRSDGARRDTIFRPG